MVQLPVVDSTHPYNDRGDYVPEDDEGDVTDFTEGVDGYAVRGGHPGPPCYPVTVGEVIQGGGKSYRIEHKLGHGSFSTIWLAYEIGTNTSRIDSPATDHCLPPETCCPPELFHQGFEPTYESDMWGFMCVFTTLMTGFNPFTGWSDSGALGRDSLGDFLDRTREDIGPREREFILEVMHKGFLYQPSKRLSAQQLLDDESFRELMSIHGIDTVYYQFTFMSIQAVDIHRRGAHMGGVLTDAIQSQTRSPTRMLLLVLRLPSEIALDVSSELLTQVLPKTLIHQELTNMRDPGFPPGFDGRKTRLVP
ncbi:hypothetical protein LA080_011574 [Diaporthe eres]|nr:hypothetical protein LA080_011574 [Diaporthe eres]